MPGASSQDRVPPEAERAPSPSPTPLSDATLGRLHAAIAVPTYQRDQLRRSIVHLGVGGFHRAHFATYVNELCRSGHTDWSITGAGVLPHDRAMADALRVQDHLYTLITRAPDDVSTEIIGSIVDFIHVVDETDALTARIADPATQVLSLTITEGGYPVDDLTGDYLTDSPSAGRSSVFGIIAAGLERRRTAGLGGLTIMSCDNIMGNGGVTRTATLGEADRTSSALADWIESSSTFPNSMVDRITPATTEADRVWLADTLGLVDRWPVVTEPFRQWVLEDTFAADRLPIEDLDVLGTSNVEPYELMKLRLLNAGHSCLAYLAAVAGIESVDAAMAAPDLRSFVEEFLRREAKPVLPAVVGIDVDDYIASIIERFSNPAIGDQIARLCLDGSAKFPKFLLPTVRAQLAAGGSVDFAALALAGWCVYLTGPMDGVAPDPLLGEAVARAERSHTEPAAFLAFSEVFGTDLPRAEPFSDAFVRALRRLRVDGVQSAVAATLREAAETRD